MVALGGSDAWVGDIGVGAGREGGRELFSASTACLPDKAQLPPTEHVRTMGKEDGEEGEGLLCPEPAFHCRLRSCNHQGDSKHTGVDGSCRLEAKEVDGSRVEA